MLVDADIYFRAVREAVRNARHSVFILSWDIDSRVRLVPEGANDGYPEPLGDFLHAVVTSRPDLHVYVLNWDFAMLYALEREWLPVVKLQWRTHQRLAFRMDPLHPIGGSHHQKIVVVDDSIAFVGGLDLTRARWDTPEHAGDSPWRHDADGKPHAPFHDVQALVDGDAAHALGELARVRWRLAEGTEPVAICAAGHDPWPRCVVPDIHDVEVAISRTEPAFQGSPGVHEVRQLHLDAIAAARHRLFFENQYFTSGLIADALAQRLCEDDGPEVLIISPRTQSGWLERVTMGVLRARVHRQLKQADRYHRYRMMCPQLPDLGDECLNVHSKVFAVDEEVFSIGSANLSSRSMVLDTECNLTIEARGDARIRAAIARLRNRLLAEHLGTALETVTATLEREPSLQRAIDALQHPGRTLELFDPSVTPEVDSLILDRALFDPEQPIEPDALVAEFVPHDARRPVPRRMILLGLLTAALIALALAWRWTPLGQWANLGALIAVAERLDDLPFTPLAMLAAYVIAGLLVVPITLLIAVTGIVFGPLVGTVYALSGTMLSAAVTYGLGVWLGRDAVLRLLGPRINRLSQRIARRGVLAIVIVRLLPIAPFTVVNIVAGASHIRFRDYLLGSLLGVVPGIVMTVIFMHHLVQAIRNPSAGTLAVLVSVTTAIIGTAFGLQRLLRRRRDRLGKQTHDRAEGRAA